MKIKTTSYYQGSITSESTEEVDIDSHIKMLEKEGFLVSKVHSHLYEYHDPNEMSFNHFNITILEDKVEDMNIEKYLKENGFTLESYYNFSKEYIKKITDSDTLYVRIESIQNQISYVKYETKKVSKFDEDNTVYFETINTLSKLDYLVKALN